MRGGNFWRRIDRLGGSSCEHKEAQWELLRAIDDLSDDEAASPQVPAGVVCDECGFLVEKLTIEFIDEVMEGGGGSR